MLRFTVERSGRVIDYAVVKSSGYPDLDAALDEMMRGADPAALSRRHDRSRRSTSL